MRAWSPDVGVQDHFCCDSAAGIGGSLIVEGVSQGSIIGGTAFASLEYGISSGGPRRRGILEIEYFRREGNAFDDGGGPPEIHETSQRAVMYPGGFPFALTMRTGGLFPGGCEDPCNFPFRADLTEVLSYALFEADGVTRVDGGENPQYPEIPVPEPGSAVTMIVALLLFRSRFIWRRNSSDTYCGYSVR